MFWTLRPQSLCARFSGFLHRTFLTSEHWRPYVVPLAKCFTSKYLKFVVDCSVFQYFSVSCGIFSLIFLLVSSTALKDVLIHPRSFGVCRGFLPQANLFLNELIGYSISVVLLTFVPRPDVSVLTTLSSPHQVFFLFLRACILGSLDLSVFSMMAFHVNTSYHVHLPLFGPLAQ